MRASTFSPIGLVLAVVAAGFSGCLAGDDGGIDQDSGDDGSPTGSGASGGASGTAGTSGGSTGSPGGGGTTGGQPPPSDDGLDACGRPLGNQTESRIAVNSSANFSGSAHRHDWWGCDTQVEIMNRDIKTGPGGVCAAYLPPNHPAQPNGCNQGENFIRLSVVTDGSRPNIVFPGTGKMEIQIRVQQVLHPFDFGVIYPDGKTLLTKRFLVDSPSENFVMDGIAENNTDRPHFRQSGWIFGPFTRQGSAPHPASLFIGPFHVTIIVHRDLGRELPVDPPHPDFWNGDTQRVLAQETKTCLLMSAVGVTQTGSGCSAPPLNQNRTVMMGTTKLVVSLKFTGTEAVSTKLGLQYCPGGSYCASGGASVRAPPTTDGTNQRTWEIVVRPEQWDSPYSSISLWTFGLYLDDDLDTGWGRFNGSVEWTIEIFKAT